MATTKKTTKATSKKEDKAPIKKVRVNHEYGLNVRAEPSKDAEIITVAKYNDLLKIVEEKDGYGCIGKGWVKLEFTREA